ncbi:MAG TPA: ATP-binding protein [Kofleriaceae bacterium]|jgi:two-component system chemotaxis sensor kinase CheA
MTRIVEYLRLPAEVTPFEDRYLRRLNKVALGFFWLHPPVFALVALLAGTSVTLAVALSLGAMIGPTLAYVAFAATPRVIGLVYGVTAMLMGGVLVYIGQGPMQIEMHFYFFVLIALLAVFANPMVVIAAAVTVAAHHAAMWIFLPRGVFNYDATVWTVVVHGLFVVIESVAACFVARSFFDNVIGLERIVENRTRDMTRLLDNVAQGVISVDFDGVLGTERSRALATWFGEPPAGARLWDYLLERADARTWMQFGFESLRERVMPFEVIVDQLPRRLSRGGREFRVDYLGIGDPADALLVVVSDITDEVARQHAEDAQRELLAAADHAFRDRAGFSSFLGETNELVGRCTHATGELVELKRDLHTLKGNTALFGVTSVSSLCHVLEEHIAETGRGLEPARCEELASTWQRFSQRVEHVLGLDRGRSLVVGWDDYCGVVSAIAIDPEPAWMRSLRAWGSAPTRPRLEQFGEYARMLATRLGKPDLVIEIDDGDVQLFGDELADVWPTFVHAVRNMVDHGIESPDVRAAVGKHAAGTITLATHVRGSELWLEIADDGAGIDWRRVRDKAIELGLPADSLGELEEALFAAGVSTATKLSDVSGRGIGMDALRTMCRDHGGHVEVSSEPGRGTRISCVMPISTSNARLRAVG